MRPIPEHPDYSVDENGEVWTLKPKTRPLVTNPSADTIRVRERRGVVVGKPPTWRRIPVHLDRVGYHRCTIDGKSRPLHRLICAAHHGAAPFPKAVVRHLNGTNTDNRPENLAWGTAAENTQDMRDHLIAWAIEQHEAGRSLAEILKVDASRTRQYRSH